MPLTPAELELNCSKPGADGALWRLVKNWNPDGVGQWLKGEQLLGTDVDTLAKALGAMLATATAGFAMNCNDPRAAVMGSAETKGVVFHYQTQLQARVDRQLAAKSPGGVFMPTKGFLNGGG